MGTSSEVRKAPSSRFAQRLVEKGWGRALEMCLIDTGKEEKALILPREVCIHLAQEDPEYWQAGDFSLLEMLYPEWYDEILLGLGLKT